MTLTLQRLEERIEALEREVADLKKRDTREQYVVKAKQIMHAADRAPLPVGVSPHDRRSLVVFKGNEPIRFAGSDHSDHSVARLADDLQIDHEHEIRLFYGAAWLASGQTGFWERFHPNWQGAREATHPIPGFSK